MTGVSKIGRAIMKEKSLRPAAQSKIALYGRKKKAAAIAAAIATAIVSTPAESCRLFTRWHYPWPQRCGLVQARMPARPGHTGIKVNGPATVGAATEDRSWYIEITKMPSLDEAEHQHALDVLRKEQRQ